MTKGQAKVLAGTLIIIAILLLIASIPFGIEYIRSERERLFPSPLPPLPEGEFRLPMPPRYHNIGDLFIFMVLSISAVSLAGLGLFILKGKRKNNKGTEKKG